MSLPIYRSPAGSPYRLGLVKSTQQGKWPTGPRRSRTLPGQTRVGGLLGRDQNNTSHHATALNRGLSTNFGWVGDGHIKLSWHRSSQDDRRSHPRGEVLCLSSGTSLGTGSSSDKPHGTAQPQQQQTPQPQPQQQQQQAQPQQQQPWWRFGGRGPSIVPPGSGAFLIPIVLFAMGVFVLASAAYSNFVFGAPFKASLAKVST